MASSEKTSSSRPANPGRAARATSLRCRCSCDRDGGPVLHEGLGARPVGVAGHQPREALGEHEALQARRDSPSCASASTTRPIGDAVEEIERGAERRHHLGHGRELGLPAAERALVLADARRHAPSASRPGMRVAAASACTQPTGLRLCGMALEAPTPSRGGGLEHLAHLRLRHAARRRARSCRRWRRPGRCGRGGRSRHCGARATRARRRGRAQRDAMAHRGSASRRVLRARRRGRRAAPRAPRACASASRSRSAASATAQRAILSPAVIGTAGCMSVRPSIGVGAMLARAAARPRTAASSARSASSRQGLRQSAIAVSSTSWLVAPKCTCGRVRRRVSPTSASRSMLTSGTASVAERLASATSVVDVDAQRSARGHDRLRRGGLGDQALCGLGLRRAPTRTRASRARTRARRTPSRRRAGRACGRRGSRHGVRREEDRLAVALQAHVPAILGRLRRRDERVRGAARRRAARARGSARACASGRGRRACAAPSAGRARRW